MFSESLTIGLLLTLVFGALFFYVYSRVTYSEKRIGLIEKLVLNLKIEQEEKPIHVLPRIPPQMTFHQLSQPQMFNAPPSFLPSNSPSLQESVKQESVRQEAVKQEAVEEVIKEETLQSDESMYNDVLEEAHNDIPENTLPKLEINYESMTKDELLDAAKAKGVRVGNRPGREKLIQLLKKSEEMKTTTLETVSAHEVEL